MEVVRLYVFPTPVGVFPRWSGVNTRKTGLPHARGGVSRGAADLMPLRKSSPRPWGCFYQFCNISCDIVVFPTPVGVFLLITTLLVRFFCLPHARGGVSDHQRGFMLTKWSSPRPWGCFYDDGKLGNSPEVFPTPVGVFPEKV